jgi:hypothetical protein
MNSKKSDGGKVKIHLPLDHPELDALALRIRQLIFSCDLTENEHGTLIKQSKALRKADILLARVLYGRPLPPTDIRPLFWDDYWNPFSPFHGRDGGPTRVEVAVGWVFRVAEYVEKLVRKYSDTAATAKAEV